MDAERQIPVSVLTGFLGSGKTTVLNRLLRHPRMANVMVILNEFGEIGLDHELVESATDDMILLQSGCLCCTIRSDLIETLGELLNRRDRGDIGPFNRVVIETTGLAEPAPILQALMTDPDIAARFRVDGVATTVDAILAVETFDRHEEAVNQVAVADRLLLTKTDLVDEGRSRRVEAELQALNPAAPIIRTIGGDIEPDRLFDVGLYNPATKAPDIDRWLGDKAFARSKGEAGAESNGKHHETDGAGHDHRHDRNRHSDHIRATCLSFDGPIPGEALDEWLKSLFLFQGPDLLRFKAIVNVAELPGPVVLHGVQHVIHPPVMLKSWPGNDRRTRMVFITHDIDEETLRQSLARFVDGAAEAAR